MLTGSVMHGRLIFKIRVIFGVRFDDKLIKRKQTYTKIGAFEYLEYF